MKCRGKFDNSKSNLFDCNFNDVNDTVYIYREDFGITITKEMFENNYEIV